MKFSHERNDMPVKTQMDESLLTMALNELAWTTLNGSTLPFPENTAVAIERFRETFRQGSLALTMAMLEIASAIKEHGQQQ
jgi:hypothetical protein